jgi:translation initiation factor IF-3
MSYDRDTMVSTTKLIDYGKYKYNKGKEEKEKKKKQQSK